ncbi:hypothetical protein FIBSPDRAFT_858091, partial [Athelia psychrophila]
MTETAYRRLAWQDAPGYIVSTCLLTKITIPALVCGTGVLTTHTHTRPSNLQTSTDKRRDDSLMRLRKLPKPLREHTLTPASLCGDMGYV